MELHELPLSEALDTCDPHEVLSYIADWYEHEAERQRTDAADFNESGENDDIEPERRQKLLGYAEEATERAAECAVWAQRVHSILNGTEWCAVCEKDQPHNVLRQCRVCEEQEETE